MEFLVKLFDTATKAADDSTIPREVVEEYLKSDDYKEIIDTKVAWGGITHKDRKVATEYQGTIGLDDQVLVSDNATHYITSLYFKDQSDSMLYATAETFDPKLFAGKRAENIQNVIGMIQTGVKMPVSVVIQALWSPQNVCVKIIRIKGFDFTQNNAFPNAGYVKTVTASVINPKDERSEQKAFSYNGEVYKDCTVATKVFSIGAVEVVEKPIEKKRKELFDKLIHSDRKEFSTNDIFTSYGVDSTERKIANAYKGRTFSKDELISLSKRYSEFEMPMLDTSDGAESIWNDIKDIVTPEQAQALAAHMRNGKLKLPNLLVSIPKSDPNYKERLKEIIERYLRTNTDTMAYSTINSVKDREVLIRYPRISMIDRVFKVYKGYYDQYKDQLTQLELQYLVQLFIQDVNLMIKRVQGFIYNGVSLTSLYALNRYGEEIGNAGKEFSMIYRKILILEKNLGFIPEVKYKEYITSYNNFLKLLVSKVFGIELTDELTLIDKIN